MGANVNAEWTYRDEDDDRLTAWTNSPGPRDRAWIKCENEDESVTVRLRSEQIRGLRNFLTAQLDEPDAQAEANRLCNEMNQVLDQAAKLRVQRDAALRRVEDAETRVKLYDQDRHDLNRKHAGVSARLQEAERDNSALLVELDKAERWARELEEKLAAAGSFALGLQARIDELEKGQEEGGNRYAEALHEARLVNGQANTQELVTLAWFILEGPEGLRSIGVRGFM